MTKNKNSKLKSHLLFLQSNSIGESVINFLHLDTQKLHNQPKNIKRTKILHYSTDKSLKK